MTDFGVGPTEFERLACRVNGKLDALVDERQASEEGIEPTGFEELFARSERPIRFALSARFGFEVGREATADAMTYAWEHWGRVAAMDNPAGYVYRVGSDWAAGSRDVRSLSTSHHRKSIPLLSNRDSRRHWLSCPPGSAPVWFWSTPSDGPTRRRLPCWVFHRLRCKST